MAVPVTIYPEQHTHAFEKTDAVAATCEQAGNIAYWTCSECGKIFSDAAGTTEITQASTVTKATGHKWGDWKQTKAPTCAAAGKETRICANDPAHTESRDIAKMGHAYGEWKKLNATQHQRVCTHDASHTEKANHTWDKGKVTKKATLTAAGTMTYTCTACKATKTTAIPKVTLGKPKAGTQAVTKSKGMQITWKAVKGANGYRVAYRKAGGKWTVKNTTAKKYTAKGHKNGALYEYKVAATKKATAKTAAVTGKYSAIKYRYYKTLSGIKYTAGSKSIKVKWNKDAKANGYIVLCSTNKNGANAKQYVVKGSGKKNYTIKGLKKGKTYYVQVRSYIDKGGHRYHGITSKAKAVKAK